MNVTISYIFTLFGSATYLAQLHTLSHACIKAFRTYRRQQNGLNWYSKKNQFTSLPRTQFAFTLGHQQDKMAFSYSPRQQVVIIGTISNNGRLKSKRRDSDVDEAPADATVQVAPVSVVTQKYRILKFVVAISVCDILE